MERVEVDRQFNVSTTVVGGSQKSFQTDWTARKKGPRGRRPYGSNFWGIRKK